VAAAQVAAVASRQINGVRVFIFVDRVTMRATPYLMENAGLLKGPRLRTGLVHPSKPPFPA